MSDGGVTQPQSNISKTVPTSVTPESVYHNLTVMPMKQILPSFKIENHSKEMVRQ